MQLLYATSNPAKYTAMRDALKPLGIRLISLRDMEQVPVAPEEGDSPLENARQKALFYYDHYGVPLFSCDSGLYLENLPQELQPGLHVRSPRGVYLDDGAMLDYYGGLAARYGDITARYHNAICLVLDRAHVYESMDESLASNRFLITAKPHEIRRPGFPLDSLSKRLDTGAYYYDGNARDADDLVGYEGFVDFFRAHALSAHRNDRSGRNFRFSIRRKILLIALSAALPFLLLAMYLLASMLSYSRNYDEIVSNITVANNYNLNFKENMDESLYKLVVGYVSFDRIAQDPALEDPYALIRECRSAFSQLLDTTVEEESKVWIQSMLRNIDTLEKRVDDIRESALVGGNYNENIWELDNNIYILTELIQDDIQYYIYYQTRSMEKVTNQLHRQISQFLVLCSVLAAALALVVLAITFLIAKGILQPIQELYDATEKVAEGDFAARARIRSQDEIAALGQAFNNMAENMQALIDQVREDEEKMRRMDLRLLQEQINPHFLYNTLDTIVWLIESNETDQAVNMVITLSNFFRLVLSRGKEFITIREEEKHIRSYLEIQEMRYHDILEYDIQMDQTVYDFQIPKLTLQPLVENALYHGIKYKRARGYIHIHGERDGDLIHLVVRDNGVGMDQAELELLRREICRPCQETEKGFGLANVNERIQMYFGEEYGLKISSVKGKGTIVEIIIPAVRMTGEAESGS